MSGTTIKIGIVAVLVGLVGAYAAKTVLLDNKPEEPAAPQGPTTTNVPLASLDLPADRVIRMGDIGIMPMTREQMRERGWDLSQVMLSAEQVIGRRLKAPIGRGDPFLTTSLYPEGVAPSVTDKIRPGYRAVTMDMSEISGSVVEQNASVDVIFRATPRSGGDGTVAIPETTVTLMQGVKVLAINVPEGGRGARSVTLEVTPQQATVLQAIEGRGTLSLVARPPAEVGAPTPPLASKVTLEELLGIEPPPVPPEPPPPPAPQTVTIYRRGRAQTLLFPPSAAEPRSADGTAAPILPRVDEPVLPKVDDVDESKPQSKPNE